MADVNAFVRVARVGKLYKLIKITRLIRLLKVIKKSSNVLKSFNEKFKIGAYFEKLAFFLLIFLLLSHVMACIWIFTAEMSYDELKNENHGG
jgi:hypothetical protein